MMYFQQVDTTVLGLSEYEAMKNPYIASMGVYVFRTDVLLELLKWKYPSSNDFGSEIIPSAVAEHNVQVRLHSLFLTLVLTSFHQNDCKIIGIYVLILGVSI